MIPLIDRSALERFRGAVAHRFGLQVDDTRLAFLGEVLARRLEATSQAPGSYLALLERPEAWNAELRALAQELTVCETYFFRASDQLRAFAEVAVPSRLAARAASRRLHVLSAGCASGEEPYSLAILLAHLDPGWQVSIRAVDVNPAALQKAARGRYSPWSLRETPPNLRQRWFRAHGSELWLDEAIRRAVVFEERNLAEDAPELWPADHYDVVLCRNTLMYFTPEAAKALVARISRSLSPGGYLFLGHAETLRGLSNDFHLHHTHGVFYYERRLEAEPARTPPSTALRPAPLVATAPSALPDATAAGSWVASIDRAAGRIQALAARPAAGALAAPGPLDAGPSLWQARELLAQERFVEALALLGGEPAAAHGDPDVLLLRAALLTQGGRFDAADQVCKQLLALDELNAGAHYLLALGAEARGDCPGAVEHDQIASYLDPAFAMPRLHLGLLARRAGRLADARRELDRAYWLLQREDASRVLLFGGGFGREALVALCRAELLASGGRP